MKYGAKLISAEIAGPDTNDLVVPRYKPVCIDENNCLQIVPDAYLLNTIGGVYPADTDAKDERESIQWSIIYFGIRIVSAHITPVSTITHNADDYATFILDYYSKTESKCFEIAKLDTTSEDIVAGTATLIPFGESFSAASSVAIPLDDEINHLRFQVTKTRNGVSLPEYLLVITWLPL